MESSGNTRQFNSMRNTLFGLCAQVVHLILSFICRTILIKKLGAQILGINGLFVDILQLLSLAELGVGNTLLFSLYKPLKENDEEKLNVLIRFFARIYNIITLTVFLIGLALMPFLKYIISSDINISNKDILVYYLIFLINSCVSYVFCYKQSIINAAQKNFVIKISNLIFNVVSFSVQVCVLIFIKDYRIYLIVQGCFTLIQNIVLHFVANKMFPYLKRKSTAVLERYEKKDIKKNIISVFFYRIGVAVLTSTDNILISTLVSTVVVGYYSNYNLLISSITAIISIFTHAIYASVGNLAVEDNARRSYLIFNFLLYLFEFLAMACAVCFFVLFDDFIVLWVGVDYVLSKEVVIIICLSFYVNIAVTPIWVYRENYGLFHSVKHLMLVAALINIILSIILGLWIGLAGILVSTIIAKLVTIYINEPRILFKKAFKVKPYGYFLRQGMFLCIAVVFGWILKYLLDKIAILNIWVLILKAVIIFVTIGALFILIIFKTKEFEYGKKIFNNIKKRIRTK